MRVFRSILFGDNAPSSVRSKLKVAVTTGPNPIRLKIRSVYVANQPRSAKFSLLWTFQLNRIASCRCTATLKRMHSAFSEYCTYFIEWNDVMSHFSLKTVYVYNTSTQIHAIICVTVSSWYCYSTTSLSTSQTKSEIHHETVVWLCSWIVLIISVIVTYCE